jgi:hypothetical protein
LFKLAKGVVGDWERATGRMEEDEGHRSLTQNRLIFIAQANFFLAALPGELLYPVGT